MDTLDAGLADLARNRSFDRYAGMPQGLARLVLGLLAVFLLLAAVAPGYSPPPPEPPKVTVTDSSGHKVVKDDDNDLRLYRLINQRLARGDDYYVAATEEQRANSYPVAPGLTVRLPTLAFASAWLGPGGMIALEILLCAAMMFAMLARLKVEPGSEPFRMMALALLMTGIASGGSRGDGRRETGDVEPSGGQQHTWHTHA